ncbi:MAG: hypothetical protein ABII71_03465 [Candidatus Micrarchaeota archaeon]
MASETYAELNKAWKATCRMIFKEEVGELGEFENYLKEAVIGKDVASVSGKPLWVTSEHYCGNAKFIEFGKDAVPNAKPLDINSIKDIDSLLEGISENVIYSGNKILGNSKLVEHSDAIVDGTFILNSSSIQKGKCEAYVYMIHDGEFAFGSTSSGDSSHIIRCFYNNSMRRCFECSTCVGVSDGYYCYNTMNCTDLMFCFHLRAKHNMIGNVQLEKEKYQELKEKLVAELCDEMKRKKRADFSIINVFNGDVDG